MKKSLPMSLVSSFLLLPTAQAAITINLPNNTEPLLLNAEEIEDRSLTADNGTQQIVFKYQSNYRQQGQRQRFTSDPVILTFTGEDSVYTIELSSINSSKDAIKFNHAPNVTITNNHGESISYHIDTLTKEGIQLGRNYQQELKAYNLTSAPAALLPTNTSKPISIETQVMKSDSKTDDTEQIDVGKMLDFWYQQADQETKKAFKKRINAQKE
ncbi:DUF2057 domain-containing protein [Shewanella mesophila]|uniref:YccT family protein n=1 Tax=Shewanella mesophila TaxID=2864208 RepID=UPI001C65BB06|nr:DUF2057 domain-containing protein [Shewanella mesophila]QYJ84814.1 DUF2057 domain-containing protein [Shewanella mesophila]